MLYKNANDVVHPNDAVQNSNDTEQNLIIILCTTLYNHAIQILIVIPRNSNQIWNFTDTKQNSNNSISSIIDVPKILNNATKISNDATNPTQYSKLIIIWSNLIFNHQKILQ